MIVRPRWDLNEYHFEFYTYDPTGRDVIIPIRATSEDEAWSKFKRAYGTNTIVDQIIRKD